VIDGAFRGAAARLGRIMLHRAAWLLVAAASACVPACVVAQVFSADLQRVFREAHAQNSDLARYLLLERAMATARPADLPYVAQLFAFSENELGLYNEALRDFPLRSAPIPTSSCPTGPAGWPVTRPPPLPMPSVIAGWC